MIKAVIFDLDGLLVNSEVVYYRVFETIVNEYGYEYTLQDYMDTGLGKTGYDGCRCVVEKFNLPITTEECLRKTEIIERKYISEETVDAKPGAFELLDYLIENNYPYAIASSNTTFNATGLLKNSGLAPYFDKYVFAEDIIKGKPDPEIFFKAAELMNEKAENCLVLEDSGAGIEGAIAAGMKAICIPDLRKPGEETLKKTLAVLNSLDEVIDILKESR